MWHFEWTKLSVSLYLSLSLCVQSLQMRRWINSTVWTTVVLQLPTPTTPHHRAPQGPPTRPPTHTHTHSLMDTHTLLLYRLPARTKSLRHIGPTGTHTPASMFSFVTAFHHLSIISSHLSVPFIHLLHLSSIHPVAPSILFCLHLSVSFSSLC